MQVNHVCERSQIHQLRPPTKIENNATVRGIPGLFEQQEEMEKAALPGAVGSEEAGHLTERQIGFPPRLEILQLHARQHFHRSCRGFQYPDDRAASARLGSAMRRFLASLGFRSLLSSPRGRATTRSLFTRRSPGRNGSTEAKVQAQRHRAPVTPGIVLLVGVGGLLCGRLRCCMVVRRSGFDLLSVRQYARRAPDRGHMGPRDSEKREEGGRSGGMGQTFAPLTGLNKFFGRAPPPNPFALRPPFPSSSVPVFRSAVVRLKPHPIGRVRQKRSCIQMR